MGQLLREGVAELYAGWRDTIRADIATIEAKIAKVSDAVAALEIQLADALREEERLLELQAREADAEEPDIVIAAAIRERKSPIG
jgi:hypothetical protein